MKLRFLAEAFHDQIFGDGFGNYSVPELWKYAEENLPVVLVPINKIAIDHMETDEPIRSRSFQKRAEKSDTAYPVLLIKYPHGIFVADGMHRLIKLKNRNEGLIRAYIIPAEKLKNFNPVNESKTNIVLAMKNAKKNVDLPWQNGHVLDPHCEEILSMKPEILSALDEKLASFGLKQFKFLDSGFQSAVFKTDNGNVVRIQRGQTRQRVNIPEMLQSLHYEQIGPISFEILPFVETKGITDQDVQMMQNSLLKKGYEFVDPGTDNLGKLKNGNLVVIDPEAIRKRKGEER